MSIRCNKTSLYRLPDLEDGFDGASGQFVEGTDDEFEDLLLRAMRIDVPDLGSRKQRPSARQAPIVRPRWVWGALAATVILGVGFTVNMLRNTAYLSTGDIAQDVVVHVHHESRAFDNTSAVSQEEIQGVLTAAGATMSPVGTVSYVKLCPFRGEMVAHFVVQEATGPVTVLLLPDEQVSEPVAVNEDGVVGTIISLETGGSIAVVGSREEQIEDIKNRVAAAVKWRL
ncbi:MAG: DUF3379 family protein [Gammaproteobacteria bacterium]